MSNRTKEAFLDRRPLVDRFKSATTAFRQMQLGDDTAYREIGNRSDQNLVYSSDRLHQRLFSIFAARKLGFGKIVVLIHEAHMYHTEELVTDPKNFIRVKQTLLESDKDGRRFDTLAGVLRSPDGWPNDTLIAGQLPIPAIMNGPELLHQLTQQVEALFPINSPNSLVNEATVNHVLSAIQLAFVLIHPFVDGNGRVSEDILYALYARRPDLQPHYISTSGLRNNLTVRERDKIFSEITLKIMNRIAQRFGLTPPIDITDAAWLSEIAIAKAIKIAEATQSSAKKPQFEDILTATQEATIVEYARYVSEEISSLIESLKNPENLVGNDDVSHLADNLATSSTVYTLSDEKKTQVTSIVPR